jgi:hypothetical protein
LFRGGGYGNCYVLRDANNPDSVIVLLNLSDSPTVRRWLFNKPRNLLEIEIIVESVRLAVLFETWVTGDCVFSN